MFISISQQALLVKTVRLLGLLLSPFWSRYSGTFIFYIQSGEDFPRLILLLIEELEMFFVLYFGVLFVTGLPDSILFFSFQWPVHSI